MADFVVDTFTDTAGTALGSHTSEETWTEHGSYATTDPVITDANRLRTTNSSSACWYASSIPASADYSVTGGVVKVVQGETTHLGPAGRIATAANTMYFARYLGPTTGWQLYRIVAGTAGQLGTTQSAILTSGQRYACTLDMAGSTIRLLVDGAELISVTDTNITSAGRVGFRGNGDPGNTIGFHLDDLSAEEAGGGTTLTVPGLGHAHALGALSLAQKHALSLGSLGHGQALGALDLTQAHVLSVGGLSSAQALDPLVVTQRHTLVVGGLGQVQTLDGVTLSLAALLDVAALSHGQALAASVLTQRHGLAVGSLAQAQSVGALSVTQRHALAAAGLLSGHTAGNVDLDTALALIVASMGHGHDLAAVALSQAHLVAVDALGHAHALDALGLGGPTVLTLDDLLHGHTLWNLNLYRPGDAAAYRFTARDRTWTLTATDRTWNFTARTH